MLQMEFSTLRPLISGVIGAVLAAFLMAWWSRFVPQSHGRKSGAELVGEYRWLIRTSNAIFIACVIGGVAAYKSGVVAQNDASALLISFGAGTVLPLLLLLFVSVRSGRSRAAEAFNAICIASKTPVAVAFALFVLGAASLMAGLTVLLLS